MSKAKSKISAHVLDTALGRPAADLTVRLEVLDASGTFVPRGASRTNEDGRVPELLSAHPLEPRVYRVVFETEPYLLATQQEVFYPRVEVLFRVREGEDHYHIPLLLSPYGYSTYRGS